MADARCDRSNLISVVETLKARPAAEGRVPPANAVAIPTVALGQGLAISVAMNLGVQGDSN